MAPLPEHPAVTVLAVGDPLVAITVADLLEADLRQDGQTVKDVHSSLRVSELLRREGDSIDATSILPLLSAAGIQVLVFARIESLGERELSFYGRKDVAHVARLRIDAFRVTDQRALGSGWSERLEYTTLNAAAQAEQAARSAASGVIDAVREAGSR